MKRSRRLFVAVLLLAMAVPLAHSSADTPEGACTLSGVAEGWALLSADQARPFFEAPLPVDAAIPHVQSELTNITAVGRAFVADPGLVARGQVESARPIPSSNPGNALPAGMYPLYTVPQPVFPASAPVAQPGGERVNSFGVGGAMDPSGQFTLGAARADSVATETPPSTQSRVRIQEVAFNPGPNAGAFKAPSDAPLGPNARGFVTVGHLATRSESFFNADDGSVRSLAASSLSEVEIAGIIKFRTLEVLASTISGEKPSKSVTLNVEGFAVQGRPMPLDAKGLEAANAALKLLQPHAYLELLVGDTKALSNDEGEIAQVQGITLRGYSDDGGDRRRLNLVFGYARASSKCLASDALLGLPEEPPVELGAAAAVAPEPESDTSVLGDTTLASPVGGDAGVATPAASVPFGPAPARRVFVPTSYTVRWNWDRFGVKWWKAGDIFTVLGTFGLFPLAGLLLWQRRRLTRPTP